MCRIELDELYVGPPCVLFGPLLERILPENIRILKKDILREKTDQNAILVMCRVYYLEFETI